MRDFNEQVIEEFRARGGLVGGKFDGHTILLLHHRGAKSGLERVSPLAYLPDGDRYVIFGSKSGAPTNPAWYHNLVETPEVTVEIGSATVPVAAHEASGDERERLFAAQVERMPVFAEYEEKAGRTLPVIVLTPRASIDEPNNIRGLVATACRVLAANGHSDFIWGHAAARDPEGRGVWMKASGSGFNEITADDVVLVDFDGNVLEGSGHRHIEWPIHTEIMASHPAVNATVHSHPPHALALGASREPLRPVSHAGTMFVPPGVPRYEQTANLVVSRELGQSVSRDLGDAPAMLLVNHGIVTAGTDLPEAVIRAILLENACEQQLLTVGFGGSPVWSSDEEALEKRQTIWSRSSIDQLWNYLVRQL